MNFIKKSNSHYVEIKIPHGLLGYTYEKGIPTGQTRITGDETEAEFILISGQNPERKIWATRKDLKGSTAEVLVVQKTGG